MCKKATNTSSKLVRNISIYDETHRQTDFCRNLPLSAGIFTEIGTEIFSYEEFQRKPNCTGQNKNSLDALASNLLNN